MRIIGIDIQNFRKLFGCHIDISKETTLFVGANNSGKTSAMDALAKFLANRSFVFNDKSGWYGCRRIDLHLSLSAYWEKELHVSLCRAHDNIQPRSLLCRVS